MSTSEEQTGIASSSYYSLKFQDNIYHVDYNFHHYPTNDLFLFVYLMDPKDMTTLFVEIEDKDFANIPIIGEVLIKKSNFYLMILSPKRFQLKIKYSIKIILIQNLKKNMVKEQHLLESTIFYSWIKIQMKLD